MKINPTFIRDWAAVDNWVETHFHGVHLQFRKGRRIADIYLSNGTLRLDNRTRKKLSQYEIADLLM